MAAHSVLTNVEDVGKAFRLPEINLYSITAIALALNLIFYGFYQWRQRRAVRSPLLSCHLVSH